MEFGVARRVGRLHGLSASHSARAGNFTASPGATRVRPRQRKRAQVAAATSKCFTLTKALSIPGKAPAPTNEAPTRGVTPSHPHVDATLQRMLGLPTTGHGGPTCLAEGRSQHPSSWVPRILCKVNRNVTVPGLDNTDLTAVPRSRARRRGSHRHTAAARLEWRSSQPGSADSAQHRPHDRRPEPNHAPTSPQRHTSCAAPPAPSQTRTQPRPHLTSTPHILRSTARTIADPNPTTPPPHLNATHPAQHRPHHRRPGLDIA